MMAAPQGCHSDCLWYHLSLPPPSPGRLSSSAANRFVVWHTVYRLGQTLMPLRVWSRHCRKVQAASWPDCSAAAELKGPHHTMCVVCPSISWIIQLSQHHSAEWLTVVGIVEHARVWFMFFLLVMLSRLPGWARPLAFCCYWFRPARPRHSLCTVHSTLT